MSDFKRKAQSGGFEAGEESFTAREGTGTDRPDFGALEAESGFGAGQAGDRIRRADRSAEPRPAPAQSPAGFEPAFPETSEPTPLRPASETPRKKRYYSPGEVMQKKGCIGCGGMLLALPLIAAAFGLIVALL